MYNELKRKDFFLNFKFTATFHKVPVVFHNSRETTHNRTCFDQWKTPLNVDRIHYLEHFPTIANQSFFLTVAIVKQPIKALSTNSWKTAGYWNTIRDSVLQTSLFRGWKEIRDVCRQAICLVTLVKTFMCQVISTIKFPLLKFAQKVVSCIKDAKCVLWESKSLFVYERVNL